MALSSFPPSHSITMDADSVTAWIREIMAGDGTAAQKLSERYLNRLVYLTAEKLRTTPKRRADEEDVVLSTFEEFRQRAKQGQYPKLNVGHDLWQILVKIIE